VASQAEVETLVATLVGDGTSFARMMQDARSQASATAKILEGNTKALEKGASEASEIFGKTIDSLGTKMSSMAGQMRAMAAIESPWGFMTQGVKLAADAEMMETNFSTMLQSADAGKKMVEDLITFAAETPFNMPSLQQATKTLLQFGIEGENVLDTLKMLGDVSGGESDKMLRLAVAFGQAKAAGRLMGEEVAQMREAGFNPLQEISRTTGKSIAELTDLMGKGKLSVEMMEGAFKSATSAGGNFYNGMLNASKTASGLWSTMQDDIDAIRRTIGLFIIEELRLKDVMRTVSVVAQELNGWLKEMDGTMKSIITVTALVATSIGALIVSWKVGAIALGMIVGVAKDFVITMKWIVPAVWGWIAALRSQTVAVAAATGGVNSMLGMTAIATKTNWSAVAAAVALKAAIGVGLVAAVGEATFALAGGNKALRDFNAEMERSANLSSLLSEKENKRYQDTLEKANAMSKGERVSFLQQESEKANKAAADLDRAYEFIRKAESGAGEGLIDNFLFDARDIPYFGEGLEKQWEVGQQNIKEAGARLDEARKKAQGLHQALVDAMKPPKDDPEIIKAITEMNNKLALQAASWGMAGREADIYRIKAMGATEEQLASIRAWNVYLTIMEAAKKKADETAAAEKKRRGEIDQTLSRLVEEYNVLRLNEQQQVAYNLAKNGASMAEIGFGIAMSRSIEEHKVYNDLLEEGKKLTEEFRTPQQAFL
jgi:tape measure domain-containing protein